MGMGDIYLYGKEEFIQIDRDYFLREPSHELDGFTYTPYTYPHPLTTLNNTSISFENTPSPVTFSLEQNYPNPFNPSTIINYKLEILNYVDLGIYNLLGQKVASLVSKKQPAGNYQVEWDATGFASGVYYYQIETGEYHDVKKMILLR